MSTPQTDTPETDAACGTGNWIHCVDADFARTLERRALAAETRVKELETMVITHIKGDEWQAQAKQLASARASLRLRPIAEAGPVPDGMIRLYAHRIPYGPCGGDFLAAFSEPGEEDTHCVDIHPPQQ